MQRKCSVNHCSNKYYAKDYCSKHYANFLRHGAPGTPLRGTPIDYVIDENDCFNCVSHPINRDGYPVVGKNKKRWLMNRFIFTEMFGPIPDDMVVRHSCDNARCINPEHLLLGTVQDNNNDMLLRDRYTKGSAMWNAILTENDVFAIKVLIDKGKLTNRKISEIFSVHERIISDIKKNRKWKHVKL
jgi:hypothetical protein